MSGNSGFKIVAFVVVLSIGAVIVIDRFIDKGMFSSFSVFRATEAVPTTSASKPLEKKEARNQRHAVKGSASLAFIGDGTNNEPTAGLLGIPSKRHDGLERITPGMNEARSMES